MKEQAEQKDELVKKFDAWKLQAGDGWAVMMNRRFDEWFDVVYYMGVCVKPSCPSRLSDIERQAQEEAARRVLEAQDVAVGDLMKSMDRHRYQTKAHCHVVCHNMVECYTGRVEGPEPVLHNYGFACKNMSGWPRVLCAG